MQSQKWQNDLCFQGKPFNITVIQVYAPTTNSKEAEVERFYEDLQDLLELTPPKKRPFHYRGLEYKSRKPRDTWSNREIWPWSIKWCRAKANRVLPRKHTDHSKHPLPSTQETTLHMDITRWSIPNSDWLCSLQSKMEKIYVAATAAKSLQSCLTLSNPMDCSLPGSSIHGIFQARVLEWVAIAFSCVFWVSCTHTQRHACSHTPRSPDASPWKLLQGL